MKQIWYITILVFLTGIIGACKKEAVVADMDVVRDDIFTERAYDVDMLYSDSAIMRVRVRGPLMLNHTERSNPHQEFTDGIRVDFFDEKGVKSSTLTARRALRYETKGLVIVRDSVVWQSVDNKRLETSEMFWEERKKKIYTKKFVVITLPTDTIYSQGFEANQDFSDIRLLGTDGSLLIENDPPSEN